VREAGRPAAAIIGAADFFSAMIRYLAIALALWLIAAIPAPALAWDHRHRSHENRSRAVTEAFQRVSPCPSTGRRSGFCPGWIKDHIVPLCAGGPDNVPNMQWQTVEQAAAKDRLERAECAGGKRRGRRRRRLSGWRRHK
jgi:hypothetical protein